MIIDLTQTLSNNLPVYPGDESPIITKEKDFSINGYTNYKLMTGMHAGTHIDGPMHLTPDNRYISSLPLNLFIGKGCVLNVEGEKIIKWRDDFSNIISGCEIVLLNTGYGKLFGTEDYMSDNPVIDQSLVSALIERNIKMLGIDLMSPDNPPYTIHKLLLSAGILIAENLANLNELTGIKNFEVFAFPLKINADSSPARIAARKI